MKSGKPLSANTVRLARAPVAGAFKADGLIDVLRQQRAAQAAERLAAPS